MRVLGFGRVARDHRETPAVVRRRRRVVAATTVAGAGLLGASPATEAGSGRFYALTGATAATWMGGGLLSGPLHLGHTLGRDDRPRRPFLVPIVLPPERST